MRDLWHSTVKFFTSLRLTVGLLAFSAVLVFLATIDQVHLGIWAVQEKWFRSFIVLHNFGGIPVPVFPGGYFIGGLLLINLVAAHAKRFAFTWKKAGIQLVHFGLILLLLGELFAGLFQEDFQMTIREGETRNYSEAFRDYEVAFADTSAADKDTVTVVPTERLAPAGKLAVPQTPFTLVTRAYYPNALIAMKENMPEGMATTTNLATTGNGTRFALSPAKENYAPEKPNYPAAFVEVLAADGKSLGTFLLSAMFLEPERFSHDGRSWELSLRRERTYKPFAITLLKLTHEVYPGTTIPKNFSSRVRLTTPDRATDREVLIFMNNPLRFEGLTFYQYQMDSDSGYTVLQVVRNPSWILPYLSCLLMAVGLFWQFCWHLVLFIAKPARDSKRAGASAASSSVQLPSPVIALGLIVALRVLAGLVGLWVTGTSEGTPAAVGLGVLLVEFAACAALLIGLIQRRAWVRPLLTAYALFSVALLAGVVAYGFIAADIYDAILRWVIIGVHALTAAALFGLLRGFRKPEVADFLAPSRASAA